jgi:hypothetical protein
VKAPPSGSLTKAKETASAQYFDGREWLRVLLSTEMYVPQGDGMLNKMRPISQIKEESGEESRDSVTRYKVAEIQTRLRHCTARPSHHAPHKNM